MSRITEKYSVEHIVRPHGFGPKRVTVGWYVRDNERGVYVTIPLRTQDAAERAKAVLIEDDLRATLMTIAGKKLGRSFG